MQTGADGDLQIVRRNPMFESNDDLPGAHSDLVGAKILE